MYGLLFDVDGTILDSMHIWIKPLEDLFKKYGKDLNKIPKEKKGELEAYSFEDMCGYLAENLAYDMTKDEVKNFFEERIDRAYSKELMAKDGAIDFLKALKKKGYKLSVASSTNHIYLEKAFQRLGMTDIFDFFSTPEITGLKKSQGEYWKYSIDKHKKKPCDLILFDDALYAIKAAKKEGIRTVGVKDFPWNEKEWEFIKKEADFYVDNLASFDFDKLLKD